MNSFNRIPLLSQNSVATIFPVQKCLLEFTELVWRLNAYPLFGLFLRLWNYTIHVYYVTTHAQLSKIDYGLALAR